MSAAHRPRPRGRVVVLSGVWIAAVALVLLGFAEALPSGFGTAAFVGVTVPLVVSTTTRDWHAADRPWPRSRQRLAGRRAYLHVGYVSEALMRH
jgi:hypothetical protein